MTASSRGERSGESRTRLRDVARLTTTAFEAFTVAALAPLLLRARPDRLARMLEPRRTETVVDDARVVESMRITDAVLARARPLVRPGCLTRGVTRYRALRRAGVDVALCFGAGSVDGEVEAHCWLAHDGAPLFEPPDVDRFVEMFHICRPGIVVEAA